MILVKYIPLRRNNPSQFIPIRKTVPVYNFCFDDSTTFPFKLPIFLSFFITIFGWHSNKPNDQNWLIIYINPISEGKVYPGTNFLGEGVVFILDPFFRGKSIPGRSICYKTDIALLDNTSRCINYQLIICKHDKNPET